MVRILRRALWISSLLACLAAGVLWIRSQDWAETLYLIKPDRYWDIQSADGVLAFRAAVELANSKMPQPIRLSRWQADEWDALMRNQRLVNQWRELSFLESAGFAWHWQRGQLLYLTVPHWLLVALSGVIAVAAKPRPRGRFSLGDLIVAMTLIAVAGGVTAALVRTIAITEY